MYDNSYDQKWGNGLKFQENDCEIETLLFGEQVWNSLECDNMIEIFKEKEKDKFPSKPEQAKAVLRSGRILGDGSKENTIEEREETQEESKVEKEVENKDKNEATLPKPRPQLHKSPNPYNPPIPFPRMLKNSKIEKSIQDIYDILSKVNINLPLLDAIQRMPAYGNFFK
ncbi:hypothetical protein Dsin_017371 [Dipteronia sinensis]|uniref:Uncharacterized protein n=1 Tax=Dipteronia sinensis TaxID=43782 RepID=A0AAE0AGB3_9ROSI|nr:hypothetical protein Dsin_017371 [Dipteronia sinensis]